MLFGFGCQQSLLCNSHAGTEHRVGSAVLKYSLVIRSDDHAESVYSLVSTSLMFYRTSEIAFHERQVAQRDEGSMPLL